MQIVKIMGGLGNQMFEYAFSKAYSLVNQCEVLLDLSWFDEIKNLPECAVAKRVYELKHFLINPHFANIKDVLYFTKTKKSLFPSFIRKLLNIPKYKNRKTYESFEQVFDPNLLKMQDNVYFEGYFQTEKYFKDFREELLKDFTLKTELNEENKKILEQIKKTSSVSLHVRHGDYLKLQNVYKICSLEYYLNAIDLIKEKVKNPHYYIFSDDLEWVRKNFKLDCPYTIVDINSIEEGYFDLELMKNCKHNITANSSFSWWGAWLNENPNKIVIAPKTWFVNNDEQYVDRTPKEWIQLET